MPRKRLLSAKVSQRGTHRALALILLALLTLLSAIALPTEKMAGAKEAVNQHSSRTSQAAPAQKLAIQGKELYEAGRFSEAAEVWQQAASAYARVGDFDGMTQSRINIAASLQALGLYPRACNTLLQAFGITDPDCQKLTSENENRQQLQDSLIKTLAAQPNSLQKTIGLRSLGDILQKLDDLELSTKVLQISLNTAIKLRSSQNESAALLSLGNVEQAWGNRARIRQDIASNQNPTPWHCLYKASIGAPKKFYQQAVEFYQQAANASVSPSTWVEAQVNRLSALLETNATRDAQKLWPQIQSKLQDLPDSRSMLYARIKLAQSLSCLKQATAADTPSWTETAQILATTVRQARSLNERRAESYALGYLGGIYAHTQQWSNAQDLTQQALTLAQAFKATDISYIWQWQLGHLLRIAGDITGASARYTEAVNTLHSLRSDLAATSTNVQFSFRETVEPIYRQLVDLLLQPNETSQKNLKQARDVIEELQLAELENLLRCNLQAASPVPIAQEADPQAAVIYPIVLDDRIEVVLSLYRQPLRHYSTSLPKEQNIEDFLETLRQSFQSSDSAGPGFLKFSQQMYGLLLKPVEAELEKNKVKNLVFVLDAPLRNIPMAGLHDGQHYLIEKYAVVLSPSLQLLPPQPVSEQNLEVLAAGISKQIPGFSAPALPEVNDELRVISEATKSVVLSNQEFTRLALQNQISEHAFSVVHLATHGRFSSKPDQTYIRAWDARINTNELKTLLQTREQSRSDAIELLVLSACETAEGDKRATLGLAGVAVRAGARSTLATLWSVDDESTTELMSQFYRELKTGVTKAEALRRAQLAVLKHEKSPYFWAPYVLVGNWL